MQAGPFFIDFLFIYTCTVCLTAQFRVFAALSNNFEVALRYCGVSVLFCIVFGGYVLSVDKMIQDVPWVGWLAYTTPALYTYEAVMAAEFHNVNFTCATGSIIPSGPDYTDTAYLTCAYAGSKIGSTVVNGDDYLAAKYGFYYSHVWRNFAILCLFTVVFIGLTCWLSEVMEWELESAGPIQYKGSSKLFGQKKDVQSDEEKAPVSVDETAPPAGYHSKPEQVLAATESTFSWSDLELIVQVGKESRKLLDGVCGYCKPGSLTALVGASGAGKSTCKAIPPRYQFSTKTI
jgi:ATP-binding cassette subfamily G (WHITE) protein 2 (SNQ2)